MSMLPRKQQSSVASGSSIVPGNRLPNNYSGIKRDRPTRKIKVIHYNKRQTQFEMAQSCTAALKLTNGISAMSEQNGDREFESLDVGDDSRQVMEFFNNYPGLIYTSRDFVGLKVSDDDQKTTEKQYYSVINIDPEELGAVLKAMNI